MATRSTSLNNLTTTAITREIGSKYDYVKTVAPHVGAIKVVANSIDTGTDLQSLADSLEDLGDLSTETLDEIAALNLDIVTDDINKGTTEDGSRKIDIQVVDAITDISITTTSTTYTDIIDGGTTDLQVIVDALTALYTEDAVFTVYGVDSIRVVDEVDSVTSIEAIGLNGILHTWSETTSSLHVVVNQLGFIGEVVDVLPAIDVIKDSIDSINIVNDNIVAVVDVANNEVNINAIVENISDINTVSINIDTYITANDNISVYTTANDNISTYTTANDNFSTIDSVNNNLDTITAVNSNLETYTTANSNIDAINTVSTNIVDVTDVASIATNIVNVDTNKDNIDTVASNTAYITTIATDIANVNTIAEDITNIDSVVSNKDNIDTVAASITDVTTVSTNISDVTTTSTNIASIIDAYDNAQIATDQASLAISKVDEIQSISVESTTTVDSTVPASVSYDNTTNAFTFEVPKGEKGDTGDVFSPSAVGLDSDRSTYDSEVEGFSYLAEDTNYLYFKASDTDGDWTDGIAFAKGDTGVSIVSVDRTEGDGSVGTIDTYTITYSDNSTSTFNITNGNGITSITADKVDTTTTVTIDGTFPDSPVSFEVLDGTGGDMYKSTYDADEDGVVDNAAKVNNHTVDSDVPADAVFTDTIYEKPTSEPISYIDNLQSELDSKESISNKDIAGGYVGLDSDGKIASSNIPDSVLVDNDFTTAGLMATDGLGTYSIDTSSYIVTEEDPVFTASPAYSITDTDITNLDNLSGINTGDQDLSNLVVKGTNETLAATALSVSGTTVSLTKADGTIESIDTQDTTYTITDGELSEYNLSAALKSNYDSAYTHTTSLHAPTDAEANVQSDWNETDTTLDSFINNKPVNITLQGNTFNGASELVLLDTEGKLPVIDGSTLTGLTKDQVGLSNVDNTADLDKPISTAVSDALAGKLDSETLTSLSIDANVLTYTAEDGNSTTIDLSLYLDDTNLARITSGTLDSTTGIVTITRDDSSTFELDLSALLGTTITLYDGLDSTSIEDGLTANQGKVLNDNKVDNSRVLTDVPSDAVFTDTIYDDSNVVMKDSSQALATSALSISNNVITLNKGDGTSENITIEDTSTSLLDDNTVSDKTSWSSKRILEELVPPVNNIVKIDSAKTPTTADEMAIYFTDYMDGTTIDWGDGTVDSVTAIGNYYHTYDISGIYTVEIAGGGSFVFAVDKDGDPDNMIATYALLEFHFGSGFIFTSFSKMFKYADPHILKFTEYANTKLVRDCSEMFFYCTSFNQPVNFDTKYIETFDNMFYSCNRFNQLVYFNTENAISLHGLFNNCAIFNHPIDFVTPKLENIYLMFQGCSSLNKPITFSDSSNIAGSFSMNSCNVFNQSLDFIKDAKFTSMHSTFYKCYDFNQPIAFTTEYVTDFEYSFYNCSKFNQDISSFITSNATDMDYMLYGCTAFSDHDLSSWDVANVTSHTDFLTDAGDGNIEPNWA